jgi:hypothetical protein
MGRRRGSLKRLAREEEKWTGRRSPGAYERAFNRKYPNRHLSERIGSEYEKDGCGNLGEIGPK